MTVVDAIRIADANRNRKAKHSEEEELYQALVVLADAYRKLLDKPAATTTSRPLRQLRR